MCLRWSTHVVDSWWLYTTQTIFKHNSEESTTCVHQHKHICYIKRGTAESYHPKYVTLVKHMCLGWSTHVVDSWWLRLTQTIFT